MTTAPPRTSTPQQPAALDFLSLELTARCQLACLHCYAESGPTLGHGVMTGDDWKRVIDQGVALGVTTAQFVGGEPTLHPQFGELVAYALRAGLRVRVFSNLYRVRAEHWQLFSHPRLSLATSYYSDSPDQHDAITTRRGAHAATLAHIGEAVRRGIPVKVNIVDLGDGQRTEEARAQMQRLGVRHIHIDAVRGVGNAARGALPSVSSLCGQCGVGKAAVLPDGSVTPCEIGRFLTAGSVRKDTLGEVLSGTQWQQMVASIPRLPSSDGSPTSRLDPCGPDCGPNDDSSGGGGTCNPADG